MASRWYRVVVDATDPARLGRWWAEVLDYRLLSEAADEVVIGADEESHPGLVFVPAPEAKSTKNRLHIDLNPDDQAAEVERLVNMGARRVDLSRAERTPSVVLADPEGNEFCVLPATAH